MDKFYIDRQFGQAIWVDVEKGIVQKCYGESKKFNDKMNELYKGKSITFLNEDFIGRAMAGTYHHLNCESIITHLLQIQAFETRITYLWREHSSTTTSKQRKIDINEKVKEIEHELAEVRGKLKDEKERILTEHNFES